jgi:hypothetical protein
MKNSGRETFFSILSISESNCTFIKISGSHGVSCPYFVNTKTGTVEEDNFHSIVRFTLQIVLVHEDVLAQPFQSFLGQNFQKNGPKAASVDPMDNVAAADE